MIFKKFSRSNFSGIRHPFSNNFPGVWDWVVSEYVVVWACCGVGVMWCGSMGMKRGKKERIYYYLIKNKKRHYSFGGFSLDNIIKHLWIYFKNIGDIGDIYILKAISVAYCISQTFLTLIFNFNHFNHIIILLLCNNYVIMDILNNPERWVMSCKFFW